MRLGHLYPGYEIPLTWISVLAVTALSLASSIYSRRAPLPYHFVAFTLLTLMIAPLTWEHHLVLCMPAIGLILSQWERGEPARPSLALATIALFVISWKLPFDHPWLLTGGRKTLLISVKLYGILALWGFSLLQLRAGSLSRQLCNGEEPLEATSRLPLASQG